MKCLYTSFGNKIRDTDFLDAYRSLGIAEGDMIFVHSDIRVFGKPNLTSSHDLLKVLVDTLESSVGPGGDVIMPTFTYTFCKNGVFDMQKSPSEVGSLTEFFRKQPDVIRSRHPIFSVAAWGKHASEVIKTNTNSFGRGTIFDTLFNRNATILLLGVTLQECTFLHHVEQMHEVSYRFFKSFQGTIIDGPSREAGEYQYFVRPLDGTIENDMTKLEPFLQQRHAIRKAVVGEGLIQAVSARDLYDVGMAALDSDPYVLLATRPV